MIREVRLTDAAALAAIYEPYVRQTAISFEYEAPDASEFERRISATLQNYPYLVYESDGAILGYAYASVFHGRIAYQHCVEVSIYLSQAARGKGIGRELYAELEDRLAAQNVYRVYACITSTDREDDPYLNGASIAFHSKVGYTHTASFPKCGYKFGLWYSVVWMEKQIAQVPSDPIDFIPYSQLRASEVPRVEESQASHAKRALVVTAHVTGNAGQNLDVADFDLIICADGGQAVAERLGIEPGVVLGDFDSSKQPELEGPIAHADVEGRLNPELAQSAKVVVLPHEKNVTDTEAAVSFAHQRGAREVTLLGGLGGRFDHTMGNLGVLAHWAAKGMTVTIIDGPNEVRILQPGEYRIPRSDAYKYLGCISYGERVRGLSLEGVAYPLEKATLTNRTSLGVSNEITQAQARVSFDEGQLLLVRSADEEELS